jgi:predicted deacetylase
VNRRPALAVALHDISPATFVRCARIRRWLVRRGVAAATLLVIPAPKLTPFSEAPELLEWLEDRLRAGDSVAQHGLAHHQRCRARASRQWLARLQAGAEAEFVGLDAKTTARFVHAGRHVLEQAGISPRGFVAPGYAYTAALREELDRRFEWWATRAWVHRPAAAALGPMRSWALTLGTSTTAKRRLSPFVVRAGASHAGTLMRLDVHPADFDYSSHVRTLESVLRNAGARTPVTYDELLAS